MVYKINIQNLTISFSREKNGSEKITTLFTLVIKKKARNESLTIGRKGNKEKKEKKEKKKKKDKLNSVNPGGGGGWQGLEGLDQLI